MPKRDFEAGGGDKEHAKKEHAKKKAKLLDDVQALRATTASERVKNAAAAVKNAGKGEGRAPIELGGAPKKDKEREKPQKEICAICQELLHKTKTETKELKCGHVFHRGCLVPWLREHSSCPLCRTTASSVSTRGELLINTPGPAPGIADEMESYGILAHDMLDALMRGMIPAAGSRGVMPVSGGGMMVPGPGSGQMMMQLGGVGEAVPVFMLDIAAFHSMDEEDSHSMDDDGMNPFCDCEECRERDAALESAMTCHLCQAVDGPGRLDPDIKVWPCDKCGKSFCTTCKTVGSCRVRSCGAQLCSGCATKSKCKGCKESCKRGSAQEERACPRPSASASRDSGGAAGVAGGAGRNARALETEGSSSSGASSSCQKPKGKGKGKEKK